MNSLKTLQYLTRLQKRLLIDECGMIVSAELMIIMTVGVIALVAGVSTVTSAMNLEFTDIANALTGLNQSYNVSGHYVARGRGGYCATGSVGAVHAFNRGMGFNDAREVFAAGGGGATVAGSYAASGGHSAHVSAVVAGDVVAPQSFALVEESALLVEESALLCEESAAVDAVVVVETEAELEQRLAMLEAEAARLEAAQVKTAVDCPDGCPLDELREIEARIRRLRTCLEQRNVFDCDQR